MSTRIKNKDAQHVHDKPQRPQRQPGELIYPVEYSTDQQALDNWNHMFLKGLTHNLTLRRFDTPPTRILDLGCGAGLWVIEAAQRWPASNFVGFDNLKIQPNLQKLCASQPGLSGLVDRIKWMHGNFLDPLPFKSNSFDFVRMSSIGLGVPEDEWQSLLQEVSRVLKPGAFIEIIEEDLIFPCSADTIKESGLRPPGRRKSVVPTETTLKMPAATRTLSRSSNLTTKSASARLASTMALFQSDARKSIGTDLQPSPPRPTISELLDPRDHTKLKVAWNSMLHRRFLAPGLLSVLQFYFSAEFEEVETYPVVRIILPPNSQLTFDDEHHTHHRVRSYSVPSKLDAAGACVSKSVGPQAVLRDSDASLPGYGLKRKEPQPSENIVTASWASMHLAKVLSTVQGCKEAMWVEYQANAGAEGDSELDDDKIIELRKEFLAAWTHWESDMKDRIGMRTHMQNTLAWSTVAPTDVTTTWKAWRNRVGYLDGVDDAIPQHCETDICRALRGFEGRKPFQPNIPS